MAVTTAGCNESPPAFFDPETKLARVDLTNLGQSSQPFQIRVLRNDSVIHESAHHLGGEGETVAGTHEACSWMDTPGSYVVAARLGEGEWVSQSIDEGVSGSPEYVLVHIIYDGWDRERLAFLIEPGEESVSNSDAPCQLGDSTEN